MKKGGEMTQENETTTPAEPEPEPEPEIKDDGMLHIFPDEINLFPD